MQAILIDPFNRTITEVDYSGDWRQIGALIGAHYFTVAGIGNGNDIFVDDEGLIHDGEKAFFSHADYPQPLCGRGLVLSHDNMGDTVACKLTLDDVKAKVKWLTIDDLNIQPTIVMVFE